MPHFSDCCAGADTYICQVCANVYCGACKRPEWRPDITGHKEAGNVCPKCLKIFTKTAFVKAVQSLLEKAPMSLYEHCKAESGLTDPAKIREYMSRHYTCD